MSYNNGILTVNTQDANANNLNGGLINPVFAPPGAITWSNVESLSIAGSFTSVSGSTLGSVYGLSLTPVVTTDGTGTVGTIFGAYIKPTSFGTGGIAAANAYGLFIDAVTVQNTTNAYGLYVLTPTGASVNNISAYFNTAPIFGTALGVPSGGTGHTILTSHGVLLGEGSNSINETTVGTNGQLLIGSTGNDPSFGSITSSGNTLTFTSGPGSLNIDLVVPVIIANGGTNATSFNTDGVVYYDGTKLNSTTVGTAGQVLTSNGFGAAPSFQSITSTASTILLAGTLTVTPPVAILQVSTNYAIIGPTTSSNLYDILANSTFSASPGNTYTNVYGLDLVPYVTTVGSGAVVNFWGIQSAATLNLTGTGTSTQNVYGLQVAGTYTSASGTSIGNIYGSNLTPNVTTSGTGTVTNVFGEFIKPNVAGTTTGSISNVYGLYVGQISVLNTANAYGLYVQTPTGASTTNISAYFTTAPLFGTPLAVPSGGTGRTVLTKSGVLLGEGSNNINVTAAGTNGQVLIGSSTGDPSFGSITSSGNTLAFTSGPGSLNIEATGTFLNTVTVPYGGTGRTVLTLHGVLIGEGSNNINVTAQGTNGQVLIGSSTGDPSFGSITSSGGTLAFTSGPGSLNIESTGTFLNTVTVPYGGTGRTVLTLHGVLIGEGSNNINVTAQGTNGQVLIGSSTGDPSFGSITSSGGTLAFTSGPGSLNIESTGTFLNTVTVPYGGTGRTVLTLHGVLIGEGSNNINVTAQGTNGQVLIGSSTGDPSFGSITSSGGTLAFTSGPGSLNIESTGTFLNTVTVPYGGTGRTVLTLHGVLIGEGSNNINVTAQGTNGQVLIGSSTGDPSFGSITSSGGTLAFTSGPGSLNIESTGTFLNTVTVPYGGTGRTVLTLHGVLIGEGSNNINVTAQGTNGQVLIGSSTGDPSFGSITSSGGTLAFTSGPGSLNIEATGTFLNTVTVPYGGTGRTVLTLHGVLIGEGSNNINVTAQGTNGQVLIGSSTGDPSFGSITSSGGTLAFTSGPGSLNIESTGTFLNTVTVPYGGTGRTVLTLHGVLIGEGSNNINVTAQGTNGQVLIGSSTGDPNFGSITSSGNTLQFSSGPGSLNIDLVTPVIIANGGTNATSFNTDGVVYFDGTKLNSTTSGNAGQLLTSGGPGLPPYFSSTLVFTDLALTGTLCVASPPAILTVSTVYSISGATVTANLYDILANSTFTVASGYTYQNVYGESIVPTITTSGTGSVGNVFGEYINPVIVGTTTGFISNVYGLYVGQMAVTNATNAYGLYIQTPTGASVNNISAYFTTAPLFGTALGVVSGGTGQTVLTSHGILLGKGSNGVNVTAAGTNGQVLIGSSTGDPSFGSITSSGGTLAFTSGPGSLNIESTGTFLNTVTVPYGGTGRTVLTLHGVLIGEGSNNINVTAQGTNGQVLIGSSTGDPSFGSITSSGNTLAFTSGPGSLNIESTGTFLNTVTVPYGGTGRTVLTLHGVLIGEGSNNINVTAQGTNGQVLIGSSTGDPSFGSITSSGNTLQFSSGPGSLNIDLVTPVIIANGGTNATSFNTDGVVYFDGTKLNSTTSGNAGQLLTSGGPGLPPYFSSTLVFTALALTGTLCVASPPAILTVSTVYSISGATVTANLYDILANSTFTVASGYTYQNVYGESIVPTITTSGTGSVGNVFGEYINPVIVGTTTGFISNVYGLYVGQMAVTNATNAYGLYIQTPTGASVNNISAYFTTAPLFGTALGVVSGGTGQTVLTSHGILLGKGSNGVNVTAAGTNGQVLIGSSTGDPSFGSITSSGGTLAFTSGPGSLNIESTGTFLNTVTVPYGGTGRTVLTLHGVLIGEGSNNINVTAQGTNGQVLIGSSTGDPSFGSITSSGGTLAFTSGPGSLNIEATGTFLNTVTVPYGGTGRTVLTLHGVLIGEGSNNINVTAQGTNGQVLIGSSTGDPSFGSITSSGGTLAFTSGPGSLNIESTGTFLNTVAVPNGGTGRTVLTLHGVLIGEGSNNVNVTAAGTNGQLLIGSTGNDPSFGSITSSGNTLTFTSGPGSLNIDLVVPVIIANGGTNATSFNTDGVVYYDGTRLNSTTAGTAGQVLTSNGFGAAPSFQSITSMASTILLAGTLTVTPPVAILQVSTNYAIIGPTTSSNLYDILANSTFSASPGNTYTNVYGLDLVPYVTTVGSGAVVNFWGIQSAATLNLTGTGTSTQNVYGLQVAGTYTSASGTSIGNIYGSNLTPNVTTSGTGTVTNVFGEYINPYAAGTTTGNISNVYGLYVGQISVTNTTNAYGLYVQTPTGASVNNICAYFSGVVELGPVIYPFKLISASYTVSAVTDYLISVDSGSSGSTLTITLPTVSQGQVFIIKDRTGNSSKSPIQISAGTGQTIDNQSSINLTNPFGSVTAILIGTNFEII